MDTWTPSTTRAGYEERTTATETCRITVLRPSLSKTERQKRETTLRTAAENLLRAAAIIKERKKSK